MRDDLGLPVEELEEARDKFGVAKQRRLEREARRAEKRAASKALASSFFVCPTYGGIERVNFLAHLSCTVAQWPIERGDTGASWSATCSRRTCSRRCRPSESSRCCVAWPLV